jgi:prepilin-type N-terminal cleavage/methylation domain-containing protein
MTISPFSVRCAHRQSKSRGFTITELIIAATLGSIVMLGVLTTFAMLVRTGVRLSGYAEMESQTRRAFEKMGVDVRMASDFAAHFGGADLTSFTLTIPSNDLSTTTSVTYGYFASAGKYTFYYIPGANPATGANGESGRVDLITNVTALSIIRYDGSYAVINTTTNPGIKHIQISVNVSRSSVGVAAATQIIRSSAFTIRNISL